MQRLPKQSKPLQDRVASFSRDARAKASLLPPGKEKDILLNKAEMADKASQLNDWSYSSKLKP